MNRNAGYLYLIEKFDLNVCDLLHKSYLTERSQKEVVISSDYKKISYPESRYQVGDTWQDNLVFALKYEGVNLEVLKAFFRRVPSDEVGAFISASPLGIYARRVWFLYEWLMDVRLEINDLKSGNYINVVDENLQIAFPEAAATRERRYRVLNNLIGTRDFCPLVRLTDDIRKMPAARLKDMADGLLRQYPSELIYRATRYLFVKETRSSFEIERETPTQKRMDAFVSILSAISEDAIDKTQLVSLQNQIVDDRYQQSDWRKDQVYVGETMTPGHEKVHFVAVKPRDVEAIMAAFLRVLERWIGAEGADPVVVAAVMSFAFVFIHPFDDGNGRIHRYLMHYILSRTGFTPREFLFPVSAVLLRKPMEYDKMLETFSRRVMSRLDYEIDDGGEIEVLNDSVDFYRYIDFTPIVEKFERVIGETIETEWKVELDYLKDYDEIRRRLRDIVDMPEKRVNQFISFVQSNGGRLSKRKREFFAELSDEEVTRMEEACRGHVQHD